MCCHGFTPRKQRLTCPKCKTDNIRRTRNSLTFDPLGHTYTIESHDIVVRAVGAVGMVTADFKTPRGLANGTAVSSCLFAQLEAAAARPKTAIRVRIAWEDGRSYTLAVKIAGTTTLVDFHFASTPDDASDIIHKIKIRVARDSKGLVTNVWLCSDIGVIYSNTYKPKSATCKWWFVQNDCLGDIFHVMVGKRHDMHLDLNRIFKLPVAAQCLPSCEPRLQVTGEFDPVAFTVAVRTFDTTATFSSEFISITDKYNSNYTVRTPKGLMIALQVELMSPECHIFMSCYETNQHYIVLDMQLGRWNVKIPIVTIYK